MLSESELIKKRERQIIEREKRLERRDKAREQRESGTCVVTTQNKKGQTKEIKHCNSRDIVSDKYKERKTQKVGKGYIQKDSKYIENHGVDYYENKMIIRELFVQEIQPLSMIHDYGFKKQRRSYIYVISKFIDGRTFVKVGYSTLEEHATYSTRLKSFQTALIPGLKNIGFKLHYLFFYVGEIYGSDNKTYANKVEQDLHDVLRKHEEYKSHVIHLPSNSPSEWYLPSSGDYQSFFKFVVNFLFVQIPEPEDAFEYKTTNGTEKRNGKQEIMKHVTDEYYEYRTDYKSKKERIIVESSEANVKERTIGTVTYFRKYLMDNKDIPRPLGQDIKIYDIQRYSGASTTTLKHGEYYCYITTPKSEQQLKDILVVQGTFEVDDDDDFTTGYYAHIFDVLTAMKKEGTLEDTELEQNYHYYNKKPIERARTTLLGEVQGDITTNGIPKSDLLWMKGRKFRDNTGKSYEVVDFISKRSNNNKAVNIVCQSIDSTHKKVKANIYTVVKLILDYHDNIDPVFDIKHNYQKELIPQRSQTKYDVYDQIRFKKNYFTNEDTKEKIDQEFDGIIVKIYTDVVNRKTSMIYDVLFESEEWRLEAESVDQNSKKVSSRNRKEFLSKIRGPLRAKARFIEEKLGYAISVPRITRKQSPVKKVKKGTRKSKRIAKMNQSRRNLRSSRT